MAGAVIAAHESQYRRTKGENTHRTACHKKYERTPGHYDIAMMGVASHIVGYQGRWSLACSAAVVPVTMAAAIASL
jgi:hypothetical protein